MPPTRCNPGRYPWIPPGPGQKAPPAQWKTHKHSAGSQPLRSAQLECRNKQSLPAHPALESYCRPHPAYILRPPPSDRRDFPGCLSSRPVRSRPPPVRLSWCPPLLPHRPLRLTVNQRDGFQIRPYHNSPHQSRKKNRPTH